MVMQPTLSARRCAVVPDRRFTRRVAARISVCGAQGVLTSECQLRVL